MMQEILDSLLSAKHPGFLQGYQDTKKHQRPERLNTGRKASGDKRGRDCKDMASRARGSGSGPPPPKRDIRSFLGCQTQPSLN